jgi:hypothetical protein
MSRPAAKTRTFIVQLRPLLDPEIDTSRMGH